MSERCRACSHPKRAEINEALIRNTMSANGIAHTYGLSLAGVKRHKANHLKARIEADLGLENQLTIIGYATDLYRRAEKIANRAEAILEDEDAGLRSVQAASVSLRELRASIELLSRLVVEEGPKADESANADLDRQIFAAVADLKMAELPAGSALPSGVEDAVVVPD